MREQNSHRATNLPFGMTCGELVKHLKIYFKSLFQNGKKSVKNLIKLLTLLPTHFVREPRKKWDLEFRHILSFLMILYKIYTFFSVMW